MDTSNESKQLTQFLRNRFGDMKNFSPDDYLHAFGKERDALLYWSLFFPELVEVENSIFLKRMVTNEDELKEEIISSQRSILDIETSYNFVEVGYLFGCGDSNISDAEELLLAKKIRLGWDAWLKVKYPNKVFCVEVLGPGQTGSTAGVQFYEQRN